jgi:hypothetical protein
VATNDVNLLLTNVVAGANSVINILASGGNRTVTITTNLPLASTNGLSLSGPYWSLTVTNGRRALVNVVAFAGAANDAGLTNCVGGIKACDWP